MKLSIDVPRKQASIRRITHPRASDENTFCIISNIKSQNHYLLLDRYSTHSLLTCSLNMHIKLGDSPQKIYGYLTDRMRKTIDELDIQSEDQDLENARIKAVDFLNQQYQELQKESEQLQSNADWNTLTLAFYGETNAGKSTIIETLRIALNENTKNEDRQNFLALAQEHGIDESYMDSLSLEAQETDAKVHASQEKITKQQQKIAAERQSRTLFQKLIGLFRKTSTEIELQTLEKLHAILHQEQDNQRARLANMQKALEKLEHFADGRIVGDGRADFTRATHRYQFETEADQFAILDVPGIEGQEAIVQDEILAAVQKAHIVFYVTWKASPPQVGEQEGHNGRTIGTLEKIKQHLGAQSEVWTIFNKRITNPLPLKKNQLLSASEQDGIQALDEAMVVHLGEHYQKTICLSAYPAFLAVANCVAPTSERARHRKKFLEALDPDSLFAKSNFNLLIEEIRRQATLSKSKIWRSNLNKANFLLKQIIEQTSSHYKDLEQHGKRINQEVAGAKSQMDSSLGTLKSRMATVSDDMISEFRSTTREKIYAAISDNIDKEHFKSTLEETIKQHISQIERSFPGRVEEKLQEFQSEVMEVLSTLKKHLDELQSIYAQNQTTNMNNDLKISVDIHNGINWLGLLGSGAGIVGSVAAFVISTGGTGAIALAVVGVITSLVGAWKSLRGWLSSDYKKSQQREAADKAIKKISHDLDQTLTENIDKIHATLGHKLEEVKAELESAEKRNQEIPRIIKAALTDLKKMASGIDKAITLSLKDNAVASISK